MNATGTLDRAPASCTLPAEEQPLRIAEWDALFAEHLERVSRPDPLRVRLDLDGGSAEEWARDLARRKSGCCSFFTFAVAAGPQAVVLDVTVDGAHAAVLDAVQRRAAAVGRPR